jgi:TPR repeat protein
MIEMWADRAERGDAAAQYQMGYCHEMGQGVPVNLEAATQWYARAANQGHPRAQYHLGLAYAYGGAGVPWDLAVSCKWLTLAARNRIREAGAALELLKASPEQRALGESAARAFIPQAEVQTPGAKIRSPAHEPAVPASASAQLEWGFGNG